MPVVRLLGEPQHDSNQSSAAPVIDYNRRSQRNAPIIFITLCMLLDKMATRAKNRKI